MTEYTECDRCGDNFSDAGYDAAYDVDGRKLCAPCIIEAYRALKARHRKLRDAVVGIRAVANKGINGELFTDQALNRIRQRAGRALRAGEKPRGASTTKTTEGTEKRHGQQS